MLLRIRGSRFAHDQTVTVLVRPHDRVFVIRLSGDAEPSEGRMAGRVEHVDSGRSSLFASEEEMKRFLTRVLRELTGPGNGEEPGSSS